MITYTHHCQERLTRGTFTGKLTRRTYKEKRTRGRVPYGSARAEESPVWSSPQCPTVTAGGGRIFRR